MRLGRGYRILQVGLLGDNMGCTCKNLRQALMLAAYTSNS